MPSWTETYNQHADEIIETVVSTLQRELPDYASMSREDRVKRTRSSLDAFMHDFDEVTPQHFARYWQAVSYQRAQDGLPHATLLQVLLLSIQVLIDGLKLGCADDPHAQIALVEKAYFVQATGINAIYAGYEQHKDEIIASQNSVLEEISTPIIPVYQGILILPMVGAIDSRRAGVANYLLQAARAARLLGSTVVPVGIGAEIAQTMVQLGIDLTGIVTRANLQSGIEYALNKQGLAIRPA